MTSTLDSIAAKLAAGDALDASDSQALVAAPDLVGLGMLAEDLRRARHGDRVTFLRVAHLRVADAAGGAPIPGTAGEARLEGAPASLDEAVEAVRAVRRRVGPVPLAAFSLEQLAELAARDGMTLVDCLSQLRAAGLERVAAAPLDWAGLAAAADAARVADVEVSRLVVRDPGSDWLAALHQLAARSNGHRSVRVLSPLPLDVSPESPTTGYDDLKRVAVARMMVARHVDSIQVDWAAYGPKLAQVALTFGADDVDNVSVVEDPAMGPRRGALAEMRRNIEAAGLVPVERNGRWEPTTS